MVSAVNGEYTPIHIPREFAFGCKKIKIADDLFQQCSQESAEANIAVRRREAGFPDPFTDLDVRRRISWIHSNRSEDVADKTKRQASSCIPSRGLRATTK